MRWPIGLVLLTDFLSLLLTGHTWGRRITNEAFFKAPQQAQRKAECLFKCRQYGVDATDTQSFVESCQGGIEKLLGLGTWHR